jgi:hypothetical protein
MLMNALKIKLYVEHMLNAITSMEAIAASVSLGSSQTIQLTKIKINSSVKISTSALASVRMIANQNWAFV